MTTGSSQNINRPVIPGLYFCSLAHVERSFLSFSGRLSQKGRLAFNRGSRLVRGIVTPPLHYILILSVKKFYGKFFKSSG